MIDILFLQKVIQSGTAVVPVNAVKKYPEGFADWQTMAPNFDVISKFEDRHGVGYICGTNSNYLECLDFDDPFKPKKKETKFANMSRFIDGVFNAFAEKLAEANPELYTRILVNGLITRTQGNGFHIWYKMDTMPPNPKGQKLALIEGTDERDGATNTKDYVIETRGQRQLAVDYPTPGYKIYKFDSNTDASPVDFFNIPIISVRERNQILQVCNDMDTRAEEFRNASADDDSNIFDEQSTATAFDTQPIANLPTEDNREGGSYGVTEKRNGKKSPCDDFDDQTDVEAFRALVKEYGFREVGTTQTEHPGKAYTFTRPGNDKQTGEVSATLNASGQNPNRFYIFSTNSACIPESKRNDPDPRQYAHHMPECVGLKPSQFVAYAEFGDPNETAGNVSKKVRAELFSELFRQTNSFLSARGFGKFTPTIVGEPDNYDPAYYDQLQTENGGSSASHQPTEDKTTRVDLFAKPSDMLALGTYPANAKRISTGFNNLDNALNGGLYNDFIILGAPSGAGKTSYILQMALQIARQGVPVLFLSQEMAPQQMLYKALTCLSWLNLKDKSATSIGTQIFTANELDAYEFANGSASRYFIKKPASELTEAENLEVMGKVSANNFGTKKDTYNDARTAFLELPLMFMNGRRNVSSSLKIENGNGTFTELASVKKAISAITEELKRPPVIFVDYLQILAPDKGTQNYSDIRLIDENINALRQLSYLYTTPVICLTSYNREGTKAGGVSMEAGKGSNSIEYTSDFYAGLQWFGSDEITGKQAGDGRASDDALKALNTYERKNGLPLRIQFKILKNRRGAPIQNLYYIFSPYFSAYTEVNADEYANRDLTEFLNVFDQFETAIGASSTDGPTAVEDCKAYIYKNYNNDTQGNKWADRLALARKARTAYIDSKKPKRPKGKKGEE